MAVTLLMFKDLLVTSHKLVLSVACHFVKRNLVFAVVFSDKDDWGYDAKGLLIEAFHHLQLVKKQKITVIAAVFLQFLILEDADEAQLKQLNNVVAVQVDWVFAEEDVVLQNVFIINVFVTILGQTFHLFDE